ncbi:MAG: beta-ketoacyl-ACP synthase III [Desulfuromusa sp.]|nr:beta-ketoacyl-ACP synthase III [Desulfuromusa sp.]
MKKVVISGSGLFVPPHRISNAELVQSFNAYVDRFNADNASAVEKGDVLALEYSSVEFIEKSSGIKQRYVMDKSGILDPLRMFPVLPQRADDQPGIQCEMAVAAAHEALERSNKKVTDIDQVIVACSNMQRPYPAIAIEVQQALGIDGFAYDINVACSSATFAIHAAVQAIKTGFVGAVLIVSPEICSGHVDFRNRDSHFIFGDVCTAVVLESAETATADNTFQVLGTKLKTTFSNNIRNNFGFLNRCEVGDDKRDKLFTQQGRKVFKEVVQIVAHLINEQLDEHDLTAAEIQRLWLHQANLSMNQLIARKVYGRDPDPDEAPVTLAEFANTSSAGSIVAFHKHSGDLQVGDCGVICSFGAGYSVGSIMVKKI